MLKVLILATLVILCFTSTEVYCSDTNIISITWTGNAPQLVVFSLAVAVDKELGVKLGPFRAGSRCL